MNENQIEKELRRIIAPYSILAEDLKKDAPLNDGLGIDSLDMIDILFEIEEKFQINIGEEDVVKLNTIDELINLIISRVNQEEDTIS